MNPPATTSQTEHKHTTCQSILKKIFCPKRNTPISNIINILGISSIAVILIFIVLGPLLLVNNNDANMMSLYSEDMCTIVNASVFTLLSGESDKPPVYVAMWEMSDGYTALASPVVYDYQYITAENRLQLYPSTGTYQCSCDRTMSSNDYCYPKVGYTDGEGDLYVQCYLDVSVVSYMQKGMMSYNIGITLCVIGYGSVIITIIISIIFITIVCFRRCKKNYDDY
jgi:hypothetical protein